MSAHGEQPPAGTEQGRAPSGSPRARPPRRWVPVVVSVIAGLLVLAAVQLNAIWGLAGAFYGEGCGPGGEFANHLGCRDLSLLWLLPWGGLLAGVTAGAVLVALLTERWGRWAWPVALAVGTGIYALAVTAGFMLLS